MIGIEEVPGKSSYDAWVQRKKDGVMRLGNGLLVRPLCMQEGDCTVRGVAVLAAPSVSVRTSSLCSRMQ
jgi:hypothetical protein